MNLISREELKERLDRGNQFKLVNTLGKWAFEAKRIPGSINISSIQDAKKCSILTTILLQDWEEAGYPLEGNLVE
jgi:hypothetical protein